MKTICFLGDSITRRGYWIAEIFEHLKGSGTVVYNCGVSGDSASHAIPRLYTDCLSRTPDTVVMMFGMNDIGRTLYEALADILRLQGIRTMTAAVATVSHDDPYLTNASLSFHLRMGFTPVGTFRNCGCKFGRWYDLTWLEKPLGTYEENPPHPKSIAEVRRQFEEEFCCE